MNQAKIFQIFRRGGVKLNFLNTNPELLQSDQVMSDYISKFTTDVELLYSASQRNDGANYDDMMQALMQKLCDSYANLLDKESEQEVMQEMINVFREIENMLITQPGKENKNTRVLRKDGAGAMQFFISGARRYFANVKDDEKSKKIKGALHTATQLNLNNINSQLEEKQSKVFDKNTNTVAKTLVRELMIGGAAGGVILVASGGTALIPALIVCGIAALYEGIKAGVKRHQRNSKLNKKYLKPYNNIRKELQSLDKTLSTQEQIQQQNLGEINGENRESFVPKIANAKDAYLNQNLLDGNSKNDLEK